MENNSTGNSRYSLIQRIGALLGIAVLVGLSAATLWVALFGKVKSSTLFLRLLVTTISAPIAIWLLVWAFGAIVKIKRNSKEEPETEEGESGNG